MKRIIGNAIVGQSGGPTAAINATLAGVIRGVKENVHDGTIRKLYGMFNGVEGLLCEDLIDLSEFFDDDRKITTLEYTPAAALGSCRFKLPKKGGNDEIYEKLISIFKKYDIRYFFYIGGNDSMDTVAKLSEYMKGQEYEIRIVGVPKTIDNDIVGTDHTPGFGSAAKYLAVTMQEILRDCAVYTRKTVTIVEIMGRDAGWLTASSAIGRLVNGKAPDLVYLPECAFDLDEFFESVKAALNDHPNVVVAVSEGIRFADGRYVCERISEGGTDIFGHRQLSGTGKVLELAVKEKFGCKARSVELNICQRCASHVASATDLSESVRVGRTAVLFAYEGHSRCIMTIKRVSSDPYVSEIGYADISNVANKVRGVDTKYINERGNNVTDECIEYLLPLIKGEVFPTYKDGIPEHIFLK